ncbi:hypothetical protein KAU87_00495 [Candidatus Bathyarchaeota archaeon]|nr:hypothetical protein [Candidatus Bathyarchaeota archaeon]
MKTSILNVTLTTALLALTFFLSMTASSADNSTYGFDYDPWCDVNDDGIINIYDVVKLTSRYGSTGTPINKTALLLNLNETVHELQDEVAVLKTDLTTLETEIAELESRVDVLNSTSKIVIRVNFLDFTIWYGIPPPLPADYLFDVGVYILEGGQRQYPSVSSTRTGHSRFIRPTYVELVIRNGSEYNGEPLFLHPGDEVHIYVVAYFHADDFTIDINPYPSWGPQPIERWKESGSQLFIPYTIGTIQDGNVDGQDDGYVDFCDAYLQYRIETFYE